MSDPKKLAEIEQIWREAPGDLISINNDYKDQDKARAFYFAAHAAFGDLIAEVRRMTEEHAEIEEAAVACGLVPGRSIEGLVRVLSTEHSRLTRDNLQLRQERDEARRARCLDKSRACPIVVAVELYGAAEAERLFPPKKENPNG